MEFSNELRITLVDDQYKSWKRYYELCAECSTYLTKMVNYEGHEVKLLNKDGNINTVKGNNGPTITGKEYTKLESTDLLSYSETTPVIRNTISPGMYKNLAFRCLIYVMTPQFSTIKKFDLLVLLKDYSIEYSGESEANSPDLSLSFSIVGENPSDVVMTQGSDTPDTSGEKPEENTSKKIKRAKKKEKKKQNKQIRGSSTVKKNK
jgi:hypothetical protein